MSTEQLALIHTVLNSLLFGPPGELLAVSTHVSDADLREEYEAQRKQDSKTRYQLASGFKKLLIRNEKDLELLLMNNRTFAAEFAQGLSAKKR